MATDTTNPPSAARVKALQRLHAIGARRGLSHEDLRAACGVPSLSALTADDLQRHADRLEADRTESRPFMTTGASKRQRSLIWRAGRDLGLDPPTLRGFLRERCGIDDLWGRHVEPAAARTALNQLMARLTKESAARGWAFQETPDGYRLNKEGAGVPPASQSSDTPKSIPTEAPF